MKKIFFSFLILISFFGQAVLPVRAQDIEEEIVSPEKIEIYFFWQKTCPHCAKEKPFLESLTSRYEEVEVKSYEISESPENRLFFQELAGELDIEILGVPFTLLGDHYFFGWYSDEITGLKLENWVKEELLSRNPDLDFGIEEEVKQNVVVEEKIVEENKIEHPKKQTVSVEESIEPLEKKEDNNDQQEEEKSQEVIELEQIFATESENSSEHKIHLPILGEIDVKNFSLPVITLVLGALDGFNPCAMWVLIFLISLLLGMEDRKRMWILGIVFIVASSAVYFLFMAAWLNLLLFIGVIFWIRILIGLVAIGGGSFNLKEFIKNPNATCKVTGEEKKAKVFEKLKEVTQKKSFYLALLGIIVLAFAVNLVELICSAGLPAVYTQILILNDLSVWQYYAYILFYIFIFMLDDIIIFGIAMVTLKLTGLSNKYSKWSHLIGGILMVIIGILMIFKPEILMFG
jgi:glutaredoxin